MLYDSIVGLGPTQKLNHILGARIWVGFVRSGGGKTGGIASSFEDFGTPGAGEDGLKPGWIKCDLIFARALSQQDKKKGGRQGALCSAGHPNLQGLSIRFQHPFQVVDTNKIQVNGSWNLRFNGGPIVEAKSLVVQIQFLPLQHRTARTPFPSRRVFACPGKFHAEKAITMPKA